MSGLGKALAEEYAEMAAAFPMGVRSVRIGGGSIMHCLGMGFYDCKKFYEMAENGEIPEAVRSKVDYAFNCDVTFTGKGLASFLQREYPEDYAKLAEQIEPETVYEISSFDFS